MSSSTCVHGHMLMRLGTSRRYQSADLKCGKAACSMDLVEVDNPLILRHFRPAPCLAPRIVQPGGLPGFP